MRTPSTHHGPLAIAVAVGLVVGASYRAAISTVEVDPIHDAACLECHESDADALIGTAHDMKANRVVSCMSCHAGTPAAHLEEPEENPAVDPEDASADTLIAICTDCHADPHALNVFERDPHRDAGLACAACHRVHDTHHRVGLLIDDEPTLCFSCHAAQKGDFSMPTHHPVMEGVVRCSDCHQTVAQSAKQHVPSGPSETCTLCHTMFEGPFPFQHAAAVDYSTEEGGCLNCHAPHGAPNPRLLKQSYQAPDFALCRQCHSVPKHEFNSQHGSQWAGVPCSDCHVDVHGSYDNARLLDPSLVTQGCFVAGCHMN
jgi:DmsE family decaheme c-type cytochrome